MRTTWHDSNSPEHGQDGSAVFNHREPLDFYSPLLMVVYNYLSEYIGARVANNKG